METQGTQQALSDSAPRRESALASAVLTAVGLIAAVHAWRIGWWVDGAPGPGLMPLAAAIMLSIFAGLGLLRPSVPEGEQLAANSRLGTYLLGGLLLCGLPALVGSSCAFSCALFLILYRGEGVAARQAAAWALGISLPAVLIFRYGLSVPLPDPLLSHLIGF
jgi:hypothetical protein